MNAQLPCNYNILTYWFFKIISLKLGHILSYFFSQNYSTEYIIRAYQVYILMQMKLVWQKMCYYCDIAI